MKTLLLSLCLLLSLAACEQATLTPEPTIMPRLTSAQVKALFDTAGLKTGPVHKLFDGDYPDAARGGIGDEISFSSGGDVISTALVFHRTSQSEVDRLSQYYKSRGDRVWIKGATVILMPTSFVVPSFVSSFNWIITHCEQYPACNSE